MGISVNGPSGIDTASLISQLTELEMQKVYSIEAQKEEVVDQLDAYNQLDTLLNDIANAAESIDNVEDFNMYTTSSSDSDVVSVSTSYGALEGSYSVNTYQLAEREKLISRDGLITDNQAELSSMGISAGTFSINGVEIELTDTDTLEELRMKINNATKEDGSSLGVTATVLSTGDDNYRFILTADDTGSEGAEYEDISGSVLQDLGIILDASGDKGVTNETYQSDTDMQSAFTNLASGEKIAIQGTDLNGESVEVNYVKGANDTIDDFTRFVENAYHGAVTVSIDETNGSLIIEDNNGGNSKMSVSSFSVEGVEHSFSRTETGYKGSNVLATGKDAYFSVDNINMVSDTNSASGFVTGVSFNLKSVSYDLAETVSINRDYSGISKKVEDLINSYNAVSRYVESNTKYGDPEEGESSGVLMGDMTSRSIESQLKSVFMESFTVTGNETFTSLAQIGIKTNTDTGRYELDREIFEDALEDNFDEIVSMFVTEGYSDNSSVVFGMKSDETQEGVYDLVELDDGTYQISLQGGDGTVYTASRQGDVIHFSDGPAEGMYLTAKAGSGDATITYSLGLSGKLTSLVDSLTAPDTGTIAIRQDSMNRRIESYNDQAESMQRRVDAYTERLVKQFSAMEQTLSLLQSQSNAMMSQLM